MQGADVIVVGGGMAGASAAYFMSRSRRVVILEREDQPAYHSTGRSAALYTQTYGNPAIRALTVGAAPFFENPPAGFAEYPLVTPRGLLYLARADQRDILEKLYEEVRGLTPNVHRLSVDAAMALCPILRPGYAVAAVSEPDAMDLDVAGLLQGFLRGFRARGGQLVTGAEVLALGRVAAGWEVETAAGTFTAPVVVNAAGAWADRLAGMAGVAPVGLTPKRRTAILLDMPDGIDPMRWPMVCDSAEQFYFKPEGGRLMVSPADETPSEPCDAQPDEMDIAVAADRFETATTVPVRRIARRWAGLRTFAPDKTLVAGFDPAADGFFWLAGQGGYGIQTAPAMGRIAAALVEGGAFPADLADLGLTAGTLAPRRRMTRGSN